MVTRDINAIAAQRISRPANAKRLPKLHIYGRNKKGKTRFCSTAGIDNVLYLDPEHGTDRMRKLNPHVWGVEKWEDVDEFYDFARHGKHKYTWFSIDGLTRLSNMSLNYVRKVQEEKSLDRQPGMVQQKDYNKSGELMKQMLTNFHNMNAGIIYTSQERQAEAFDSEEDDDADEPSAMYVPDLPRGVRGMVNSLVDVIGRIYVVKIERNGVIVPQRRLWLGESLKYDTGYRSDFVLPDMIKNPTIPKLVQLMETGKVPTKSKSK